MMVLEDQPMNENVSMLQSRVRNPLSCSTDSCLLRNQAPEGSEQPEENPVNNQLDAILDRSVPLTKQVQAVLDHQLDTLLNGSTTPVKELKSLLDRLLYAVLYGSASPDEQQMGLLELKDAVVYRYMDIESELKTLREAILKIDNGLEAVNEELAAGEIAQDDPLEAVEAFYERFYPRSPAPARRVQGRK